MRAPRFFLTTANPAGSSEHASALRGDLESVLAWVANLAKDCDAIFLGELVLQASPGINDLFDSGLMFSELNFKVHSSPEHY